ncbi:hypothetical protein F383_30951 [Gossypium arboreum]|uniref:Uncharacterized protein n=1 Tax=Gossypium arboreum TaxID=29729 RepID=A0A0B0MXT4_GOSAR|nr:hypothetical protein F383_30951 [Gossypium arboreum]
MDTRFPNCLWSGICCRHTIARKSVPLLALSSFPLYAFRSVLIGCDPIFLVDTP